MILFIGPPGCGKGTQSNLLKKIYKFSIFSFGDYLRNLIKKNDEISSKISKLLKQGEFVSPNLIFTNIDKSIFKKKIIVDGYPRTLEQAIFLNNVIKENKFKIDLIIEFHAKEEDLLLRILNRKTCKDCQKTICSCGSNQFIIRSDDNKTIFDQRLINYNKNKIIIKNFYIQNNINYVVFNASETIKKSFKKLEMILKANNLI